MNFRDELTKMIGGKKDYSTSPLMLSYDPVAKDTFLKKMPSEKWKLLDILKRKEIYSILSKKNIKVVNSIPDENLTKVVDLVKSKIQPDAPKSEQKTPAPEEKTPAPEEKTPATEQKTPATEQKTPATEQTTPATEQTTPAPEEKTPAPEEKTPATEEKTPEPEEKTPEPEQTTPAPEEKTPATEETTPEPEEKTPATEETTPATEQTTPAQHDLDLTPNFVNVFFEYVNDLINDTPEKSAEEKNTPSTSAIDFSNPANFETKKEDDAVPDGWEKHISKNSDPGKSYFVNKKTGETTWEKPTTNASSSSASESEKSSDSLPDGWTAHVSENTRPGETYYYNEKTDETVWEKPTTNASSSSSSESEKSSDSLPDGWTAHVSENTKPGETYYYNEKTDETVWEKPTTNASSSSASESEKSSDSLPDGWTAHVSENTKPGETYYYNEKTDETVWEKPTTNASSSSASESEKSSDSLPDGWTAHVSENTRPGETYYYNEKTDETVWEKPTTNASSSSASESEKSSEKALKAPIAGKCYKCGNSNNLKLKTYKLEKDKAVPVYFCCFKCFEGIEF